MFQKVNFIVMLYIICLFSYIYGTYVYGYLSLKHYNFFNLYITLTVGRQPVVSMIESALGRCTADWKEQNAELNTKLDLLLDLQRQRLKLDEKRLEFEREMAGLEQG